MTKSRFNEIQSIITEAKESGLSTKIGNKKITLDNAERLVEGIVNEKIIRKKPDICTTLLQKKRALINLLDTKSNDVPRFITKMWIEDHDQSGKIYNINK